MNCAIECWNCANVVRTASVVPVCGLESLSAKIGSAARPGGVNIRKSSFTNETSGRPARDSGAPHGHGPPVGGTFQFQIFIPKALESARVAVFLVTQNFLDSP